MIKKLLPTMIGAALVGGMAPAAADVTVFGHIDLSVDYVDSERGDFNVEKGKYDRDETTNLNSNTSSLGFKGSEDLGNGLKAIFKIDFQYDMDQAQGSSFKDRDQWLGMAGNFGQVRVGTISTTYKSHGAMIDPLYRTSVQARGIGLQSGLHSGAGEEGQGRASDTFRYDSPNWNGLQVGAHYTLQEDDAVNDTDSPFGVGIQYKNGPFLVFADYITSDAGGDDSAYKVGGKWSFGNYALYGQYEVDDGLISARGGRPLGSIKDFQDADGNGDGADVWEIGATGTWGNNMLVAAYGQGDSTSGGKVNPLTGEDYNNEYDVFEIVGVHSFSKRTSVYGGYANVSPDASSDHDQDIITVGMKHKF